jgi:hypothetical protein
MIAHKTKAGSLLRFRELNRRCVVHVASGPRLGRHFALTLWTVPVPNESRSFCG